MCIGLAWILSWLICLPPFLWPGPLYEFYEWDFYCGIPYNRTYAVLYMGLNFYALPVIYLTLIYACLLYFIRHQTPQLARTHQGRRARRDLTVARRILFIVNALTLPVMPNVVFFPITSLNPSLSGSFYMYRIQWIGPAMAVVLTSVGLVFITPKIKEILRRRWNTEHRRVGPTVTTIQLVSIQT